MRKKSKPASPARGGALLYALLPLVLTAAAFSFALANGFTNWDDPQYILENPYIGSLSLRNLLGIFSLSDMVGANYHPLTILSLALVHAVAGSGPTGHIATNILLHLVNVLLVFLLARKLSGDLRIASLCAALFGVHPMHVESVAWISARKDVLYTAFYLASMLAWLRFIDRKGRERFRAYGVSLLLFAASLLAKPVAVTLPIALLLLDYFKGRKFSATLIYEKLPFLIPAVLAGLWTIKVQHLSGALRGAESLGLPERFLFAAYSLMFYVVKFLAPVKLSAFYPYPVPGRFPLAFTLAPLFIVAAAAGLYVFRRSRPVVFGAGFFLLNTALVLHFIPVGAMITADRYTYCSYIGLAFIAAVGCARLLTHASPRYRKAAAAGMVAVPLAFALLTAMRCGVWKDGETLWNDVIARFPTFTFAYNQRGSEYGARAFRCHKAGQLDSARYYFGRAIGDLNAVIGDPRPNPLLCDSRAYSLNNRGYMYLTYAQDTADIDEGKIRQAYRDFKAAVALDTAFALAWHNLANVEALYGHIDNAIAAFQRSLYLKPGDRTVLFDRGLMFLSFQRFDEAITDLTASIEADSTDYLAFRTRGIALLRKGDTANAAADFARTLALKPGDQATLGVMQQSGLR